MARENRSWGYNRIAGALQNVGYSVSDQTVGNILHRFGIAPAPKRRDSLQHLSQGEFLRSEVRRKELAVAVGTILTCYAELSPFQIPGPTATVRRAREQC